MSKLYTQEELDTYFEGIDNCRLRAIKYAEWLDDWKDRCITVDYSQPRAINIKQWIKDQNIRRVDYQRADAGRKCVNYYFRYEEDYLAAVLRFA